MLSYLITKQFQSTRLSRASTWVDDQVDSLQIISIHKALASLDQYAGYCWWCPFYFNPQGSREPRRHCNSFCRGCSSISIHKALASLDDSADRAIESETNFNPQGSREPRLWFSLRYRKKIWFQSTRLSRASTAKMHNYSCIYATFTCFILYIFYKSFIKLKFPRVI